MPNGERVMGMGFDVPEYVTPAEVAKGLCTPKFSHFMLGKSQCDVLMMPCLETRPVYGLSFGQGLFVLWKCPCGVDG
jgi:hypothetical protein